MRYQVSAIRAKPVRPGLQSPPPTIAPNAFLIFFSDAIITGSWDRTVRFWDPRAATAQQSSHKLPERIYFMDSVGHRLVLALASRLFHIFDIRKMDAPEQTRESSLKFLTRPSPSCPVAKVTSCPCPYGPFATTKLFPLSMLCDRV